MEAEGLKPLYSNLFWEQKEGISYLSVGPKWGQAKGSFKIHQG